MAVRVGINGFGRIGRSFTGRSSRGASRRRSSCVAVNDPFGDAHTMAFLLKHDSVGRTLPNEVKHDRPRLLDRRPRGQEARGARAAEIPWGDDGVDVVIESTGLFTAREKAAAHLEGRRQARRHLRADAATPTR